MPLGGNRSSTFGGVEKVVYLLMGPSGGPGLVDSLRGAAVTRLRALGARGIQLNVTTPGMASPFAPPPGDGLPALEAAVSMWVDAAEGSDLAAALPEADWLEYSFQNYKHLAAEPIEFRDGYAIAPDRPGHGLKLSDVARREHAVDTVAEGVRPTKAPPGPIRLD